MRRTQLYLNEDMARLLAAESRRRGTTVSALVREAVAAQYGRPEANERATIIHRLAGVWAGREDIGATATFVRGLRRSTRPERWSGAERGKIPARQRHRH